MLIKAILLSLVCPIVLPKYGFNRGKVLNNLLAVEKVAGMDAEISAICDSCGTKLKCSCLNKTFT